MPSFLLNQIFSIKLSLAINPQGIPFNHPTYRHHHGHHHRHHLYHHFVHPAFHRADNKPTLPKEPNEFVRLGHKRNTQLMIFFSSATHFLLSKEEMMR